MRTSLSSAALCAAVLLFGTASPAYAYLDPGTGSMLLQLVLGGVAGALAVGRLYWHRLKALVTRRPASGTETKSPRK